MTWGETRKRGVRKHGRSKDEDGRRNDDEVSDEPSLKVVFDWAGWGNGQDFEEAKRTIVETIVTSTKEPHLRANDGGLTVVVHDGIFINARIAESMDVCVVLAWPRSHPASLAGFW